MPALALTRRDHLRGLGRSTLGAAALGAAALGAAGLGATVLPWRARPDPADAGPDAPGARVTYACDPGGSVNIRFRDVVARTSGVRTFKALSYREPAHGDVAVVNRDLSDFEVAYTPDAGWTGDDELIIGVMLPGGDVAHPSVAIRVGTAAAG